MFGRLAPLFGLKVECRKPADAESYGNAIYIANHQNNYDMVTASNIVQPPTVTVGKKSLLWIPFFGQLYWLTGNLLIKPQKVTLMVDDVPVAQVLQALAEQEKLNLVVSPDVSGTVSLHLTDVPWKQALQTVVKSAGLITRQEGNILSVHSIAWQNNNIARQEAEQARAQANLPLENRSITLQYADAGELAKAGEKLLSAKGSMTVDKRTNRLLLRDNKTALSALEQWVAQMDLPVGQVELSAHIVTINEKSLRELGVKWTLADAQHAGGVGQVTTLGSDLSVATATTHVGFNIDQTIDNYLSGAGNHPSRLNATAYLTKTSKYCSGSKLPPRRGNSSIISKSNNYLFYKFISGISIRLSWAQ